ncbi:MULTISPECIES: c-type cytochrome [Alphaproteobacteria]|jgi:cytochrome c|uniref:Cytochrome c2 n=1 Tax=Roseovarius mucosus DSM 17069 TaxID=1288298 RepID=A0A0A0HJJ0_9RHOB|nr:MULTISPECIES: c-type cytochrome [Alphaproteobacteria]KGM86814.1 Cytochrome c2 [Roseovarius mucosus DSM 17069]MAO00927.1 cytochrome C [Roseovarius sp.]HBS21116.1 cytochrome C [Thalassospira sp.]|tara:strand:+ start:1269 stop:1658 length:390 start_codon:yes stop_codon:yes gene_type:complete
MKTLLAASATLVALSLPAFAEGDAAKGEKEFNKCKACHMIASDSETIVKGGKTGPNLYGVIGRTAGSYEGFKYSDGLAAKGAEGLVWDEAELATFVKNPNDYLGSRSKMTFKLAKGGEDVAAYLATFSQ